MKTAFLILTYKDVYHKELIKLNNNEDIYIHPKFTDDISEENKKFLLPKEFIIETKWGDMSIINAILNLLSYAYSKKSYDYFILLSEDTYPMMDKNEFNKFLQEQNGLSCFEYLREYDNIYKSYVWWMINNKDAGIIVNTRDKYKNIFKNIKINGLYTYDELYFLTILKREIKDYKYNNKTIIYTSWLHQTVVKHPFIYNKLTKYDIEKIKKLNIPFLRKTLKTFQPNEYKIKNKILLSILDEKTDQELLLKKSNEYDIILIYHKDMNNVKEELKKNCLFILNIIWDLVYDNVLGLIEEYTGFFNQYKEVLISNIGFNFNIKKQYDLSKYPPKKLLIDDNNKEGFVYTTPIYPMLKFNTIKKSNVKRNNLLSVSFFKMKHSYRDFGIYETFLKNFLQRCSKLKDYIIRIYVDSSTKNNKVLELALKYDFIEILEYECPNFKIDNEYYSGTFGTLIRLYPLFDHKLENDSYQIIRVSDIDLQFNSYFTGREESMINKNDLDFLFLKYIPYIKPWSNPQMNHTILGGLILSKIKFPKYLYQNYLEDVYLSTNNSIENNLTKIIKKVHESVSYKYSEKNLHLPYGIDELFLNYYLYPHIKFKKFKYGMRAELFPSQIMNILKLYKNLSELDRKTLEKLKDMEKDIYYNRGIKEKVFIDLFMKFIPKFKNKISDQYDVLLKEVNKYKDYFKDNFVFFLIPNMIT